jgi:hypothetical protein
MGELAVTATRPSPRARLASIAPSGSWQHAAIVEIRATLLAGMWLGALVGGVGGRLAMLVLRLLSPETVHGVVSDDGFIIGRVTLSGSYNLIAVGALIGTVGASAYRWVDPWLIGPGWFRQLTSALGAGAVVGSMLVHADGVDFRLLRPLWLAVALFVLVPAVFGFFIGPFEQALARPESWVHRGRRGWIALIVSIAAVPPLLLAVAFVAPLRLLAAAVRHDLPWRHFRDHRLVRLSVRGAWLGIAVVGLLSLVSDARAILA